MKEQKWREGSMGADDAKVLKRVLIVFSTIFGICFLLFLFNIGGNFFHYYFTQAALGWKVLGILSIPVYYWFLWTKWGDLDSPAGSKITAQSAILFLGPVLIFFLLAGWSFPLP